jgi:hypothetical protein
MKIEGRISILINREYTTIEIKDDKANTTFVKATLTPDQLSAALSRQVSIECDVEVHGLERVGKKHENKTLEFEIPKNLETSYLKRDEDKLQKIAQSHLSDGWIAERYFGFQGSFFTKDGKQYARCTIRRWI